MALVTLCPECRTTFRITPEQLKACGGEVRCGHCQQVFNSFATLITVDESEIGESRQLTNHQLAEQKRDNTADARVISGLPGNSAKSMACYLNQEPEPEADPGAEGSTKPVYDPAYNFDAIPQRININWQKWLVPGLCFFITLLGLMGYIYRGEIANSTPVLRPFLERVCLIFSCRVPYQHDITLLSIESSDLQVDAVKNPGVAELIAIIRNHAPFSQELPVLRLTLTDQYDQVVASYQYTPAEYLGENKEKVQVIAPGKELNIHFKFNTPDSSATGYRLFLLSP